MTIRFQLPLLKPSYARWFIDIDISNWIGTETIQTVNFSAKEEGGEDGGATSTVLDVAKCTRSDNVLKPYIMGGESGKRYHVIMQVVTAEESRDEFALTFKVNDL